MTRPLRRLGVIFLRGSCGQALLLPRRQCRFFRFACLQVFEGGLVGGAGIGLFCQFLRIQKALPVLLLYRCRLLCQQVLQRFDSRLVGGVFAVVLDGVMVDVIDHCCPHRLIQKRSQYACIEMIVLHNRIATAADLLTYLRLLIGLVGIGTAQGWRFF